MSTTVAGVGVEAVEYQQETGIVRTQFDQEKTPASMAVIATLADVMGVDPVELKSLHSTVDPEALNALVRVRDGMNGDIHSTFSHEGHTITVYSYGVVTVTPGHEPAANKYGRNVGK
ncbi:HalOD1 output domain-containing protein [Natronosalvus amylolyticus]|uniref:HalOD1 output domain-containing protein n=1 Tax=Natronosalvus amylolyticus TaxID=2961994 RepID=UPI0020C9923E|nr:HalOD1 output domain-containing protein [Natronosalvus amylolyticus]